jgi:hypothetical protein
LVEYAFLDQLGDQDGEDVLSGRLSPCRCSPLVLSLFLVRIVLLFIFLCIFFVLYIVIIIIVVIVTLLVLLHDEVRVLGTRVRIKIGAQ